MLDAGAAQLLAEHVDLRGAVVRAATARCSRTSRPSAGPSRRASAGPTRAGGCGSTSFVWNWISQKRSKPITCSSHRLTWPSVEKFDVVWSKPTKPSRFCPPRGVVVLLEAGVERAVAAPLDEAERRVAERRRDREAGELAAARVLEAAHVVDRRAAAALEQAERLLRVLDLEVERADAVGVLAQPAPGPAALAARLDAHDHAVARHEGESTSGARPASAPRSCRRSRRSPSPRCRSAGCARGRARSSAPTPAA